MKDLAMAMEQEREEFEAEQKTLEIFSITATPNGIDLNINPMLGEYEKLSDFISEEDTELLSEITMRILDKLLKNEGGLQ